MKPIDWQNAETRFLFNPASPSDPSAEIRGRVPALAGHLWILTSGTSGAAKWTALSKNAILASARAVNAHLESSAADCWLHALPDFHVGGLGIRARAHLSGAGVTPLGAWDPVRFHEEARQSTLSALVPAQVFDLVKARLESPPSMRAIIVGGGALSESLYIEARALGWKLLPSYGMTECASQIATAPLASTASLHERKFPELSILPHLEVSLRDGHFHVRGASLLTGYFTEEKGFTDPKTDGWLLTEDRGEISGRTLRIAGRSSDFVKIGGESVDLSRLDQVMAQAGADSRFALIAAPDARLGHVVHLVFESSVRPELANAVFERFNALVLPFERARKARAIEKIPRTGLGKIKRAELARLLL